MRRWGAVGALLHRHGVLEWPQTGVLGPAQDLETGPWLGAETDLL